jgi:GTP pyrophosphokinase
VVQIRTVEMHLHAELGIAAHWKYKEGRVGAARDEPYFVWLRQLLEWQQEVRDPQEFIQNLKIDLYPEEVYTFTPKGQVKPLPRGATPVDFAYSIHTDVGNQCVGARVNGRMVTLRTPLKNGDIVEIVTQAKHQPSRDWLNFVVTSRARNKIKHYLEGEEKARAVDLGRRLLEKEVRRFDLNVKALLDEAALEKAAAASGGQKVDEMLAAVGFGRLQARQVLDKLVPAEQLQEPAAPTGVVSAVRRALGRGSDRIKVRGADDVLVVRARCCNPIQGEKIVGYITRGKGVSVHSANCPNVANLLYASDRRIEVEWDRGGEPGRYSVDLKLSVEDRKGLLAEISAKIADINTNITSVEARSEDGHLDHIAMTVEIHDLKHLEKVLKSIRKVPGVLDVERAAG